MARASDPAPEASDDGETRRAGRGLFAIAGAKIYFIITAYAIQLALPRILGSPEAFGLYAAALSAVSMLNMILIAATIQSVSKFVSEDEEASPALLRQGLRIQLGLGGLLAGALFLTAPPLAAFLRDDALVPLLRAASVVVFAYALYAAVVGSLNGRRLFGLQARLDMGFSTLRTMGILGGATLGIGALGAMAGFATAAMCIMLASLVVVGRELVRKTDAEPLPLKRWFAFMAPIWTYQAFLNGCLQIDVQVMKKVVAELALGAGSTAAEAATAASTQVGFYRAAQTFAFVPYQLILAMTFIIFPMISRATAAGDAEAAQRTIRGSMRFSLLLLLSVAAPVAGAADGVMRVAYPEEYLAGAPALGVLVFGLVAFALFVIAATVLSSAGRPGLAAAIAAIALVVVVVANWLFINEAGAGGAVLVAAASATTLGTTIACLLAGGAVFISFKAFIPMATIVRGLLAGAAGFAVAHFVPHESRLMALVALAAGFVAFGLALVVLREVRGEDLRTARSILLNR
ncbi:MAG: lipopolysaccharide biosynthesis protein [Deltaproteobacteria bacterium]|nr:lipopolysaccharide biosynthesis protein [Deltaproteobacteria bacterium]